MKLPIFIDDKLNEFITRDYNTLDSRLEVVIDSEWSVILHRFYSGPGVWFDHNNHIQVITLNYYHDHHSVRLYGNIIGGDTLFDYVAKQSTELLDFFLFNQLL